MHIGSALLVGIASFMSRHLSSVSPSICLSVNFSCPLHIGGWSGGAMVLGKLPVPGRSTILITVGQGPIALAVGAGGGGLDIFTLVYPFSSFSPLFGRRFDSDID